MSDEREKHIQSLAWELVLRGWDSNNALAEADLFVCCCESREADIAEAKEREAEATPEPGSGDYGFGLYAMAVAELGASVDMWFIEAAYRDGFTPTETVERWREHEAKSCGATHDPGEDHEFESYLGEVRELVPGADRYIIQCWHKHNYTPQQSAEKWLAFLAFTEQQRKGVNP